MRHVVQRVIGAFHGQRQGLPGGSILDGIQTLDRSLVERAGGQAVHGLGRQGHQFAFGQGLHGTMHDVAQVFGAANIDDQR